MKLLIIRHGESEDNVARVISGQSDARLTVDGMRQAELLGQRLKNETFDGIFSSDLVRARQTTDLAVRTQQDNFICLDRALRERNWGIYENRPIQLFKDAAGASGLAPWEFEPTGGESLSDLLDRLTHFVAGIFSLTGHGNYLISAHHAINKVLIMLFLRESWEFWRTLHQDNTCLNVLVREGDRFRLELLNCTKHLSN